MAIETLQYKILTFFFWLMCFSLVCPSMNYCYSPSQKSLSLNPQDANAGRKRPSSYTATGSLLRVLPPPVHEIMSVSVAPENKILNMPLPSDGTLGIYEWVFWLCRTQDYDDKSWSWEDLRVQGDPLCFHQIPIAHHKLLLQRRISLVKRKINSGLWIFIAPAFC